MEIKNIRNHTNLPIHIYSGKKGYTFEYEIVNNYIKDFGEYEAKEIYINKDRIDIFI